MYLKNFWLINSLVAFSFLFGLPVYAAGSFYSQSAYDSSMPRSCSGDVCFVWKNNSLITSTLSTISMPVYNSSTSNFVASSTTYISVYSVSVTTSESAAYYRETSALASYYKNGTTVPPTVYSGYSEWEFRQLSGASPAILFPGQYYLFIIHYDDILGEFFLNIHDVTKATGLSGFLDNYLLQETSLNSRYFKYVTAWTAMPAFALYDRVTGVYYSNAVFNQQRREFQCSEVSDTYERAMCYMFTPDAAVIDDFLVFKAKIEKKPPFGYFNVYSNLITSTLFTTSSTSTAEYFSIQNQDSGLFGMIKKLEVTALYLLTGIYLFQRLRHLNFHE